MRTRLGGIAATLTLALALPGGPVGPAVASTGGAAPVRVFPASNLDAGDPVRVTASGLPANTAVTVVQCVDPPNGLQTCETGLGRGTTTTRGRFAQRVRVADPVYSAPDDCRTLVPVYCRADNCRIFIVWQVAHRLTWSVETSARPVRSWTGR